MSRSGDFCGDNGRTVTHMTDGQTNRLLYSCACVRGNWGEPHTSELNRDFFRTSFRIYLSSFQRFANLNSSCSCVKATPSQSLVPGHPPAWYFEKPIYGDYNDTLILIEIMTCLVILCLVRAHARPRSFTFARR